MASYSFTSVANTSIAFNPGTDTLDFDFGWGAPGLSLALAGSDTLVSHSGLTVRLLGVPPPSLAGTQFVFADGSIYRQGSVANDTFTGTMLPDQFELAAGGNDKVSGGDGDDLVRLGASLTAADTIAGGAGYDELHLAGNYASTVVLGATTVTDIEKFMIDAGGTVRLRLDNAVFTSTSGTVVFDATAQGQTDALLLDGSPVTWFMDARGGAGADTLLGGTAGDSLAGGVGSDSLVGGSGADTIDGGLDADTLTGGAGADRFAFHLGSPRTDASPTTIDTITDFTTGDLLDLPGINEMNGLALVFNADALAFNYTGGSSGTQDAEHAFDGFVDAYWRNNTAAGRLELWVDGNDDGLFSETDLLVHLTNTATGKTSLVFADFVDNFVAWRGTAGPDLYAGNAAPNQAFGLGGNDNLNGGAGNDQLYGGTGNDQVAGATGADTLWGGTGSDTLYGDDGDDELHADGQDIPNTWDTDAVGTLNVLNGGTGNDYLTGGAGNDRLNGDADNDTLLGSDGNDTLTGGAGADMLYAEAGADSMDGGAGNDTLIGGFYSSSVIDTLVGGDGDDELFGLAEQAVLTGGLGADRFVFTYANFDGATPWDFIGDGFSLVGAPGRITDFNAAAGDLLRSGIGDGTHGGVPLVWRGTAGAGFTATPGQSMALAGSDPGDTRFLELWTFHDPGANQTILFVDRNHDFAVDSSDLKIVFDGNIALSPASFTAGTFMVKVGTTGADANTNPALTSDADLAYGFGGNDTFNGLDGDDTLNGDAGNDSLIGGYGIDRVYGGAGADILYGDAGRDSLWGGTGGDTLYGGDGDDEIYTAGYADSALSSWDEDTAATINTVYGGFGNDSVSGSVGRDRLNGDADSDTLYGGSGIDTLNGGDGADLLQAGSGADSLNGGTGNDTLYGGWEGNTGVDTLVGGDGDDVLYALGDQAIFTGGLGADRFAFTNANSDGANPWNFIGEGFTTVAAPGRITDFNAAQGDLVRSGIGDGTHGGVPLVWRGAAAAGFTATVGQGMALAGSDPTDTRFLEFWTFYDAGLNQTVLFVDRNHDFAVDADDMKIVFNGNIVLSPGSFTPGTFTVKVGTSGADANTAPLLGVEADLAFGLAGNDTLDGLDGDDTVNGDAGNDYLSGGTGMDHLHGGVGADFLQGNFGADTLYGGGGSDTLNGGDDADELHADGYTDSSLQSWDTDGASTLNVLNGGWGNDSLVGAAGWDWLNGDGNDDTILGQAGNDTITGGSGADVLYAEEGADNMDGGAGNDTLYGGFYAATTIDTLAGGDGDDALYAFGEQAVLTGGLGVDRFCLTYANWDGADSWNFIADGFSTVAAPDRITDFDAAQGDLLRSGIGDGTSAGVPLVWRGTAAAGFTATEGQGMALAGSNPASTGFLEFWTFHDAGANQTVLFVDRNRDFAVDALDLKIVFDGNVALSRDSFTAGTFALKVGTAGADANTSPPLTDGSDLAFGLAGNDTLNGLDGDDSLNGDDGNDSLSGALGADQLFGGNGADVLNGDTGKDSLWGGSGGDTLHGGDDADELHAEGYRDSTRVAWDADTAATVNTLNGGAGNDDLYGGAGRDRLNGDLDDDTLSGGDGIDTLNGGDGADALYGGLGADSLNGGAGNDNLYSGSSVFASTDTLVGGDGNDVLYALGDRVVLTGGLGADRFVFTNANWDGASPWDFVGDGFTRVSAPGRITDFNAAEGDLLRSGVTDGLHAGAPLVWRGTAAAGFTATAGQSLALAGADAADPRFLDFWTFYNATLNQTVVFSDLDRDFLVDSTDLKIVFDGNVALSPASFTAGTFKAKLGTAVADTNTTVPMTSLDDIQLGARGNDTLNSGAGNDVVSGNQGADVLNGSAGNDKVLGGADNDSLYGGEGNDSLWGGTGSDTLDGGNGNDSLHAGGAQDFESDSVADAATAANRLTGGAGNDTLYGDAGADTLYGGGDDDELYGGAGDDKLYGEGNDDTLYGADGADTLDGGDGINRLTGAGGNDTYYLRYASDVLVEDSGGGNDTVLSYLSFLALAPEFENGTVMAATGAQLWGNAANNVLVGGAGNDTLYGDLGDDSLDGGLGSNSLAGEGGNDTYTVRSIADAVTENPGEGMDSVLSYLASYALAPAIENATIVRAAGGVLTGNDANNSLAGSAGSDTLDGGLGADTLAGGNGNDTYYVDHTVDVVKESADATLGGVDTVISGVTRTLGNYQEKLVLSGAGAINGTGNELPNVITGNDASNTLAGGLGNDTLFGGGGNDMMQGSTGADSMSGGAGDDIYYVDNGGDIVTESADPGTDTIVSSVSRTLGSYQERLTLSGTAAIDGTGNALANAISGNSAANRLSGGGGNDTLNGGDGNDTLDGGTGADSMSGGAGDDTYYVDNALDVISETVAGAAGGTDTVFSTVTRTLLNYQENLVLSGAAAIGGTGTALANTLTGNDAANMLDGAAGNDTLAGGGGGDTLRGGANLDRLTGGSGADRFAMDTLSDMGLASGSCDVITDFSTAEGDRIDLSVLDPNLLLAGNQAFTFIGTAAFSGTDATGQLRYEPPGATGAMVYGSTDADAAAEFAIELVGVASLAAGDFIL